MNNLASAMQGISAVDVGVLLLIIVFALRAAFRGFIREIMAVAGILAAVLCGALFSGLLAPVFERWLGKTPWNQILAFIAIFAVVSLIMLFLRNTLETLIDNLQMENMDHGLGFLLGIVEGILVVFILLFLLSMQQVIPLHKELSNSIAFNLLSPLFAYANDWLAKAPAIMPAAPSPLPQPNGGS